VSSRIEGRVGGIIGGYSIDCTATADSISGRIGGGIFGGDVNLTIDPAVGSISGRFGGAILGRSLIAQLSDNYAINGMIGGEIDGNDIYLHGNDRIDGRCGGGVLGFDADLEASGGRIIGRLGGGLFGMSVDISIAECHPPVISALIAVITYYYYRVTHRNNGG